MLLRKSEEKNRKRRVRRRRDHCWHRRFFKAAVYGLTDANKVIPGNAVFHIEASTAALRFLDNPANANEPSTRQQVDGTLCHAFQTRNVMSNETWLKYPYITYFIGYSIYTHSGEKPHLAAFD